MLRAIPKLLYTYCKNAPGDQSATQGPSGLLRALKRTRAPLTAFGMTIGL
jgi:hypothetical protein